MELDTKLKEFYERYLDDTSLDGAMLKARCPFCESRGREKGGTLVVFLNGGGWVQT